MITFLTGSRKLLSNKISENVFYFKKITQLYREYIYHSGKPSQLIHWHLCYTTMCGEIKPDPNRYKRLSE